MGGNRFTLFPIQYNELWRMYKQHVACFWTVEEVDLNDDLKDWEKLSEKEKFFLINVLAFFAGSDGIVNENLNKHFSNEVDISEARAFYGFQQGVETIHSEMYSLLIDTYVKDKDEKDRLFDAVNTIPCVKQKADWALKWSSADATFKQRLVAFACVEGIHFSGSFCAIFWFKSKKLLPGLCFSNELISRDEGLHTDFAVELYKTLPGDRLDQDTVHLIVKEAIDIEEVFVTESLPVSMLGMNSKLMVRYIHFVADRLLAQLGYDKIYHAENPFDFMNQISVDVKTNFFEHKVAEYRKAGVGIEESEVVIDTANADF